MTFYQLWMWFKARAVVIGGAVVAVLGAGWLWRVERDKRRRLADQLRVEQAHRQVAALQSRRDIHVEQVDALTEKIDDISIELAKSQKRADMIRQEVEGRDAAAVADHFNRMLRK